METVFDELSAALKAPCSDWRAEVSVFAVKFLSTAFTGLAFGLGFAVAMAIVG